MAQTSSRGRFFNLFGFVREFSGDVKAFFLVNNNKIVLFLLQMVGAVVENVISTYKLVRWSTDVAWKSKRQSRNW